MTVNLLKKGSSNLDTPQPLHLLASPPHKKTDQKGGKTDQEGGEGRIKDPYLDKGPARW